MEPTPAMLKHFEERTKRHIDLVNKALAKLYREIGLKMPKGKGHDASKYEKEERLGYIWISEMHRCKNCKELFKKPDGYDEFARKTTGHHLKVNPHHPEYHKDITKMPIADLMEMVADWWAMAQELGGTAKKWAQDNVGKRWKFSKEQQETIFGLIEILEGK
jgi:hypothetical protein